MPQRRRSCGLARRRRLGPSMDPRHVRWSRSGFTVLELLTAFGILAATSTCVATVLMVAGQTHRLQLQEAIALDELNRRLEDFGTLTPEQQQAVHQPEFQACEECPEMLGPAESRAEISTADLGGVRWQSLRVELRYGRRSQMWNQQRSLQAWFPLTETDAAGNEPAGSAEDRP
jgi:type II secretory pathway pseudopilin PulG